MCIGENSTRRGHLHMVIPVPVLHALLPWKVCSAGDVGRSPSLSDSEGVVSPGYQHVVSYKSLQEKAFSAWGNAHCSAQEQLNFVCMVPQYPRNLGPQGFLHVQHYNIKI